MFLLGFGPRHHVCWGAFCWDALVLALVHCHAHTIFPFAFLLFSTFSGQWMGTLIMLDYSFIWEGGDMVVLYSLPVWNPPHMMVVAVQGAPEGPEGWMSRNKSRHVTRLSPQRLRYWARSRNAQPSKNRSPTPRISNIIG